MCDTCLHPSSTQPQGSRRRRLWQLPMECHCPVIGVCFPLLRLRQLVRKALGNTPVADDYEIHLGAVAECARRSRLTELLHKDLEARFASQIRVFHQAKDAQAVAQLWAQAVHQGDVSGAFWAALTHPRCDDTLQEVLLRDMHMLQHQAGAAVRVDTAHVQALIQENGVLGRELGKAQERCTRVVAEKSAEIEHLHTQLLRQRAVIVRQESQLAFLRQDMAQLKAQLPDYETSTKLQKKIELLTQHQQALQAQNAQLRQTLTQAQRQMRQHAMESLHPAPAGAAPCPAPHTTATLQLKEKKILCVGGRQTSVASYREVIEQAGGHFAHHDGGVEDKHSALDAVLAAADLVICQTGCISHNAYWRVKDFCKRTGTQCVFVDNPSASSFSRNLQNLQITSAQASDSAPSA